MAGTIKVRMLVGVSGYRHDGEKWPPAGTEITVPDWEGEDLIRGQNAVAVGDEPEVHSGETVASQAPPGTVATGRAARGEASTEEIMTGHPADTAAGQRAADEQHGARGAGEDAETPEIRGARPNRSDPRPDSQILAEDYDEETREKIGLGETTMAEVEDKPAKARRKGIAEGRREAAKRRAPERNSALRYAGEGGLSGAPGSEVPALAGGDEAYPYGPGIRPGTQVEAESAVRDEQGRDITRPGLEGMSDAERAEYETRMTGATPGGPRGEPAPGQPTLREPGSPEAGSPDDGSPPAEGAGVHKVTAESDAPIEVTQEDGAAAGAPAPSAPKQDWIDFAVQVHGADVHEVTGMTKADLMSRYGGRL